MTFKRVSLPVFKKGQNWQPRSQGLSSYRLGRARRDPGRIWSRVSVTIENTRERSSPNKEFVALSFVEFKARLIASRFALLLRHYPRCFTVAFRLQFSHSIYSNVNLKVKQVICLEAIYHGRDVVAMLPTGYGKSVICHVLPSLFLDKINYEHGAAAHPVVIVVSPLNALIKSENNICNCGHGNGC